MRLSQDKKNSADLGGCYPPPPSASVDNTLLDLQNSSYPTQPHSIIANYFFLSLRAGGIFQILKSDWFRERAIFYDLALLLALAGEKCILLFIQNF